MCTNRSFSMGNLLHSTRKSSKFSPAAPKDNKRVIKIHNFPKLPLTFQAWKAGAPSPRVGNWFCYTPESQISSQRTNTHSTSKPSLQRLDPRAQVSIRELPSLLPEQFSIGTQLHPIDPTPNNHKQIIGTSRKFPKKRSRFGNYRAYFPISSASDLKIEIRNKLFENL